MKQERYIVSKQLWKFAEELNDLKLRVNFLKGLIRDLGDPIRSSAIEEIPVRVSGISDPTSNATCLIEKYQDEINQKTQQRDEVMQEFEAYISPLTEVQKKILRYRYLETQRPLQISFKVGYSETHIKYLLGKAQDILYKNNII